MKGSRKKGRFDPLETSLRDLLVDLKNKTSFAVADVADEENFTHVVTLHGSHGKGDLIGKI